MNKLSRKFIGGIAIILIVTMSLSLYINSDLIQRYYLHNKKEVLDTISQKIKLEVEAGTFSTESASELEKEKNVTIVRLGRTANLDIFNEQLRETLRNRGLGFQKFWLWDEHYKELLENGRKISLYEQNRLNYSLLVEYMQLGDDIYVVAMIIPHLTDAIRIINTVTTFVMFSTLILSVFLFSFLVRQITRPLDRMSQFALDIASRHYYSMDIHTKDELETVAISMNQMCKEIQSYQNELTLKNKQMSELLDNVAHDLKTPVALVQAYAEGIKDGMDDGTFLDTIIRQNNRISSLIESLLLLSRVDKNELYTEEFSLDELLYGFLEEYDILGARSGISFNFDCNTKCSMQSSKEHVSMIVSNLFSNALKYSSGNQVLVSLLPVPSGLVCSVTNETDCAPDLTKIWQPFYVGESSRNKELSGTGLGLALVKSSAERLGAEASCHMEDNRITFSVLFPVQYKIFL